MKVKFCIEANDEGLSIDIQGTGTDIMAALCAAMEKDPTIRSLVAKSLMALTFHDLIEGKVEGPNEDAIAEMLKKMNVGLA